MRRVRSTGDLDFESTTVRPSARHYRPGARVSIDQAIRGGRSVPLVEGDSTLQWTTLSTPASPRVVAGANTNTTQAFTIPPFNFEAPPRNPPRVNNNRRAYRPVPPGLRGKVLVFLGVVGPDAKARSQLLGIIWKAVLSFVQYVVIITLLAIAANRESPTVPGVSEWKACSRPLGVWNCIWLVRVALGCGVGYWDWRRNVQLRQMYVSSGIRISKYNTSCPG